MVDAWFIIGPAGIAIAGWFVGSEIKRLRNQVDQLLENQKQMAVQIARLEAKMKQISNVLLVGFSCPGFDIRGFLYIRTNEKLYTI